jgi:hypothetical protein
MSKTIAENQNNREIKKSAAARHNEAYLESLKPKKPNPAKKFSSKTKMRAQTLLAISSVFGASIY